MSLVINSIVPILYLLFVFCGAGIHRKGARPFSFMSREETGFIQSAACIGIVLHHVTQQITGYDSYAKLPVSLFDDFGYLFTGLFFFFSGYGLIVSVRSKPGYLKTFLGKRLPSVLIPFWIANLIGILLHAVLYGRAGSAGDILKYLFGLKLINGNGWFFVEIVILYLAFYILFRLFRNQDIGLTLLLAVVGIMIAYSFHQGHDPQGSPSHWFRGEWWYNSTIAFAFGALYARFREKTDVFLAKHSGVLTAVFAVLFTAAFFFSVHMVRKYGYYGSTQGALKTLFSQMAACILFSSFILVLGMRISIGNRALSFVNGIRTELFLLHGYFVHEIFENVKMPELWRYAVILVLSIGCAALLAPGIRFVTDSLTAFLTGKKRTYDTLESGIAKQKRKKRLKFWGITAAVIAAAFLMWEFVPRAARYLLAEKEWKEEREALVNASVGEEVFFGRFETDRMHPGQERISWIVIRRDGDKVSLLCREGIAGSSYNQKHEAVSWEDSDLRAKLNSKAYLDMFSRYEAEHVVPKEGDMLTLLTAAEALEAFDSDEDRELVITAEAKAQGTNINTMSKHHKWDMKGYRSSWWWLRGEAGEKDIYAPIVTVDGTVLLKEKVVNKPGGAVRPVVTVDPSL